MQNGDETKLPSNQSGRSWSVSENAHTVYFGQVLLPYKYI